MWKIYVIINEINNKIYVGQTKETLQKRLSGHRSDAKPDSNIYFHRAMNKHAKNNFKIYLLEDNILTLEETNIAEKKWIKKLNALNKDIGYNITDGGLNYERTPEHREKARLAALSGWPRDNWNNKRTPEQCENISKALTGIKYGPHTEEHKEKISKSSRGRRPKNCKTLYFGLEQRSKRWRSYIRIKGKRIYIGTFDTQLEAAEAREKYIIDNNIDATLNFKKKL